MCFVTTVWKVILTNVEILITLYSAHSFSSLAIMWMSCITKHHTTLKGHKTGGNLLSKIPAEVHFGEQETMWLLLCKWGDVHCLMEAVYDLYATFYAPYFSWIAYYTLTRNSDSVWSVYYFPNEWITRQTLMDQIISGLSIGSFVLCHSACK